MFSKDANSMQALLTKLVNKKINEATGRMKRTIMSEDSAGNPAEIYGSDGKIYYRAGGNSAVEISGNQWVNDGTDIKLAPGVTGANMNNMPLKVTGADDLVFEVPSGRSFIFRKV